MCLKNDINSHNDNRFEKKTQVLGKKLFWIIFWKTEKTFWQKLQKIEKWLSQKKVGMLIEM